MCSTVDQLFDQIMHNIYIFIADDLKINLLDDLKINLLKVNGNELISNLFGLLT